MPCNVAAHPTPVSFIFNAHNVTIATDIPCHVDTEVARHARTMAVPDHPWSPLHSDSCLSNSANGLTGNSKSYCPLSILWRPFRQLLLRCSTSCIHAVDLTLPTENTGMAKSESPLHLVLCLCHQHAKRLWSQPQKSGGGNGDDSGAAHSQPKTGLS